jgi:anhydro-N-acetylmuramic acid kinase
MDDNYLAVGLMSGTSLDGIDAALIETDGIRFVRPVAFRSEPYADQARETLRAAAALALGCDRPRQDFDILAAEEMLTRSHIQCVRALLDEAGVAPADVAVVGFHGQTLAHRPDRGWTWQIGDGAAMAAALRIEVVNDFRAADVAAGGQGAPLIPVYHRALTADLEKPLVVVNIGGVANLTYIDEDALIAFDTGPGNALIDDWMLAETGRRFDENGAFAAMGRIDEERLGSMLDHTWFDMMPPKSLDRTDFTIQPVRGLGPADGAVTLTAFTAISISYGINLLPKRPRRLIVAGGGRHNATLMATLGEACHLTPEPIEAIGWNGDATEAEGFAYMAVRTLLGLPISFPGTTGVPASQVGGVVHPVPAR